MYIYFNIVRFCFVTTKKSHMRLAFFVFFCIPTICYPNGVINLQDTMKKSERFQSNMVKRRVQENSNSTNEFNQKQLINSLK